MDTVEQIYPTVERIYPSVEECKVNNLVLCPVEGCQNVFSSESILTLHLAKTHKNPDAKKSMQRRQLKEYYCPQSDCKKYFKSLKLLRQHYLKVHTEKNYFCIICGKTFVSELLRNEHQHYCGIKFYCCDCSLTYDRFESLQTHARRKSHNILEKKSYKPSSSKTPEVSTSDSSLNTHKLKPQSILPRSSVNTPKLIPRLSLPKMSESLQVVTIPPTAPTVHRGCQTVEEKPLLKTKMTQIHMLVPLNTRQTQTGSKNIQLTVETQTEADFIFRKEENTQKSAKTQTDIVESQTTSCNTSFSLEDFEFAFKTIEKNSSSTQTQKELQNIFSISTATHDSIHTDTLDLLTDPLNDNFSSFDNNFFNCHMETQTDDMLSQELFTTCDYYANMHTQTCDDILSGVGFSDTHTQTAFRDRLRSVESQTWISRNKISCKDMSNMETQTEDEFRQMLEIINS